MEAVLTLARAALENARWCDLVCGAHGSPGELHEAYWVDWHPVPPFHPRLVTLLGPEAAEVHLEVVRRLVASGSAPFAVKDSFRALELAPLGFRLLFEAEWIAWPHRAAARDAGAAGIRRTVAQDAGALARWEAAWRGTPASGATDEGRQFPPPLVEIPGVHFVSCERSGEVVATFALHASDGVVGLSNVSGDERTAFSAAATTAHERYPEAPLVGYEAGASLEVALAAGFTRVGPLAVWERGGP